MISKHPYNTWPLHVKLFSDEAVSAWRAAIRDAAPMPPGFTCSIELEGVDGKSGEVGTGRQEPLDVKDEHFTSSYLSKNTALLATNRALHCSICQEKVTNYMTDALSTALCPSASCTAVSHITCLSKKFLGTSTTALIPRGGTCSSCNTYILWGDIVRGSYRRMVGGVPTELPDLEEDEMFVSDSESCETSRSPVKKKTSKKAKAPTSKAQKPRQLGRTKASSSEGELFDIHGASSTHEQHDAPKKRRPSPKALLPSPLKQKRSPKGPGSSATFGRMNVPTLPHRTLSEEDLFDSGSASAKETPKERGKQPLISANRSPALEAEQPLVMPRRRGRPPKISPAATLHPSLSVSTRATVPRSSKPAKKHYSTTSNSSGEFFDFGAISCGSSEDDALASCPPRVGCSEFTSRDLKKCGSAKPCNEEETGRPDIGMNDLIRIMSSMSVSRSPPQEPRYVEISD
ncbi:hypothetical protein C0991_000759 [Blastosporella zonata]|nr:hypothetical protein C0991_000759 [Blastosporella zonata]